MKKRVNPVPLTVLAAVIHSTLAHANITDNLFDPDNWRANIIYNGSGELSLSYMTLNSSSEDRLTAGILYYDKTDNSVVNNIKLHDMNINVSNLRASEKANLSAFGVFSKVDGANKDLSVSLTGNSHIKVSSNGSHSAGILAIAKENGNTTINTGKNVIIESDGRHGAGIAAEMTRGIEFMLNEGKIISTKTGLYLLDSSGGSLKCSSKELCYSHIENRGLIDVSGEYSSGIFVYDGYSSKDLTIINSGNVFVRGKGGTAINNFGKYNGDDRKLAIINDGQIFLEPGSVGISSELGSGKNNFVYITNNGHISDSLKGNGVGTKGIYYGGGVTSGEVGIVNNGVISLKQGGSAIYYTHDNESALVSNNGEIYTKGDYSPGITYAGEWSMRSDGGKSGAHNSNLISTSGDFSHGIWHNSNSPGDRYLSFTYYNYGVIETTGSYADGINMTTGSADAHIINNDLIMATGENATAINVNYSTVEYPTYWNWLGITLDRGSETIGGLKGGAAIKIITDYKKGDDKFENGVNSISIYNGGVVSALNNQAIVITDSRYQDVNNLWGPADGLDYFSIIDEKYPNTYNNTFVSVGNDGTITGNVLLGAYKVFVENKANGVFELENFTESGIQQQARMDFFCYTDKKECTRKDIAHKQFENSGTIRFSDNMRGNNDGIFRGLDYFYAEADSVIDLTTNNPVSTNGFGRNNVGARDVLRFIGATLLQPDNQTSYVSKGGILRLNTDLTTAGAANVVARLTDRLIVDRTQLSHGLPTWIDIVPTARSRLQAKQTAGDGFLLVQVNDKKYSSRDAFRLLHPVVASKYEYILGIKEGDWYLTSSCTDGMNCYGSNEKKLYNPATGAWLANQAAMTAMMSHSLADRQSSPAQAGSMTNGLTRKLATSQNIAKKAQAFAMLNNLAWQQDALYSPVWVQYSGSTRYSSPVFGTLNNKTRSDVMRIGGDLMRMQWLSGDVHLGFMNTMGNSRADIASRATGTKARGEVSGYSSGLYGTWFSDAETGHGLYTDVWVQAGYFTSEIKGQAQASEKYHSRVVSSSVESGYTFAFNGGNLEGGGFTVTPQAQLTYHRLSAGNVRDSNGMEVSAGSKGGAVSRVGLRVASGKKEAVPGKDVRLNAFMESHFVRSGLNNSLDFDGAALADNQAKNSLESKFGVQLKVGERAELNSTLNHQLRKGDRDNYGAYAGLTLRF